MNSSWTAAGRWGSASLPTAVGRDYECGLWGGDPNSPGVLSKGLTYRELSELTGTGPSINLLLFGLTYLSHAYDHLRERKEDDMGVQTDERFLRNIEGYLMELVCNVESIDEVNVIADVLVSVKDALRALRQKPGST